VFKAIDSVHYLLEFPGALKSPVLIGIPASLLSLPFLGFGIPRNMFGILYSLWVRILPDFRKVVGVSVDRKRCLVIPLLGHFFLLEYIVIGRLFCKFYVMLNTHIEAT
jgi:hypothetical protein